MTTKFPVGSRISYNGHLGTVNYVGPVDNTQGIWLGVEWDDPSRGKHDGSKDGKKYFTCRFSNSASFIRPNSHVTTGISFLQALTSKYIEILHGSNTQETVTLGSSDGAIQVEAVSLDKVRQKFAQLDRLRVISLDNENVATSDPTGEISKTCPNIRDLDLSRNLLPSWDVVAEIAQQLPVLQRLTLNRNRLTIPVDFQRLSGAFLSLTELQLNATFTSWSQMQCITRWMPSLQSIEMGYNGLSDLSDSDSTCPSHQVVNSINLDCNSLANWSAIWAALRKYPSLQRVVLTSNIIKTIPFPAAPEPLANIKQLALSTNDISEWPTIDALSCWLPSLESLSFIGNPLSQDVNTTNYSRPFFIARIPSLLHLDGASISPRERNDSELFYLTKTVQQEPGSPESRRKSHFHWERLCQSMSFFAYQHVDSVSLTSMDWVIEHGEPQEIEQKITSEKLSDKLIDLLLYRKADPIASTPIANMRVLPTMSIRNLRMKIAKTLKAGRASLECWMQTPGSGTWSLLDKNDDTKDVAWFGMEHGTKIAYEAMS